MKHIHFTDANCSEPRAVCKETEDRSGYFFHSIWDGETERFEDDDQYEYISIPLRSVVGKAVELPKGTVFANVLGSTGDPRGRHSWSGWLQELPEYQKSWCCMTDGQFYRSEMPGQDVPIPGITCTPPTTSTNVIGGHIILEAKAESAKKKCPLKPGETDGTYTGQLYLLPICKSHNTHQIKDLSGNTRAPGDGYYMKTKEKCKALPLTNYFKKSHIENLSKK